jgi:RNA polymerase primary sigma factor
MVRATKHTDPLTVYLDRIQRPDCADLSAEEERSLFVAMRNGDATARARLAGSLLRYVVYYARRWQRSGHPLEDLIQEGNHGLVIALDRFDIERGTRFSTYATFWIAQSIRRYVIKNRALIRIPEHWTYAANRTIKELGGENFCKVAEICRSTPIIRGLIVDADEEAKSNEPADHREPTPFESLFRQSDIETMHQQALRFVDNRQKDILLRRADGETLESIARSYGLTRERIRQIESKAVAKVAARYNVLRLHCGIESQPVSQRAIVKALCE